MDYKESLLELIKSKKEISEDNFINLSLQEIADIWNREATYKNSLSFSDIKFIDTGFLQDVISALKKLENEKFIEFKYIVKDYHDPSFLEKIHEGQSISDIISSSSLQDKIFLEVGLQSKENIQKSKIDIFIDDNFGIHRIKKNKRLNYLIDGKKRPKYIKIFCKNKDKKTTNREITEIIGHDHQMIKKEVNNINRIFKKNLDLNKNNDLIIKITGGRKFNHEKYNIHCNLR